MTSNYAEIKAAMDESSRAVGALMAALGNGVMEGMGRLGHDMVVHLVDLVGHPGTSGTMGPVNPRSEPYMPAAKQYGDYQDSWGFKVGRDDDHSPYLDVGSTSEYSGYLEYGTINMEARPALRPTIDGFKHNLSNQVVEAASELQHQVAERLKAAMEIAMIIE